MSTRAGAQARWTLSFADLCLVLLAFLLMLQAHRADPAVVGAGVRAAFGAPAPIADERTAATMFQPGEAILLPHARQTLVAIGAAAARSGGAVTVESHGRGGGGRRFDGWELAAARAAAAARAIAGGGLDPARIDVSVAGTHEPADAAGQRLRVTTVAAPA